MPSNKGGSGRPRKSSSAKKPLKQPIPIDSGTSQTASSINPDPAQTQDYAGIEDEIRVRAYELYEQRGCQHGFHNEDWVRAEIEILAKYKKSEKTA